MEIVLTFADLFPSDKTKVTMMLLVMMMTMMMMMMMMNKDIEIQRSIGNCVQYSAATRPATLNEFAVAAFRCLVLCCMSHSSYWSIKWYGGRGRLGKMPAVVCALPW